MKLLLVADERLLRRLAGAGFTSPAYRAQVASSRSRVEELLAGEVFDAACVEWEMKSDDAAAFIDLLSARQPRLPIIVLVGKNGRRAAQANPRVTAQLESPFVAAKLHQLLHAHALARLVTDAEQRTPRARPSPAESEWTLMANDAVGRQTMDFALRVAKSNVALLILGETGTGKSRLARFMHEHSAISARPFVTVNCPCLNRELLESELFGHVRGAFTGAVQDTWGKVAAADGGTLFLDEIGDLPMSLQPKLLRLLQEKQYERVGEATPRTANVRIIAASNRDLKTEVAAGRFREDLYYRLNVIALDVPPLRQRPAQIAGATESFLAAICRQIGKPNLRIAPETRRLLETHAWPGNLRELRNVIERAAILATEAVLQPDDFPALLTSPPALQYQVGGAISLQALEDAHIQMVVARTASLEEAARILEIDKSTLYRKRRQMEFRAAPACAAAGR